MSPLKNKVIAITGAGSGIGAALAAELANRGALLCLSDINSERLEQTASRLGGQAKSLNSEVVDVADRAAMFKWADNVLNTHGRINAIINNAGVALSGSLEEVSYEHFRWIFDINFWGVVHGTEAFLPHLKATVAKSNKDTAQIINLSSVFGLQSMPSQGPYCATKFAVRSFSETLRMELDATNCGVSVTTVHPGGVKTNIARDAQGHESDAERETKAKEFDKLARLTPEKAAKRIVTAMERQRRRTLVGADAKLFEIVSKLPAAIPQKLLSTTYKRML